MDTKENDHSPNSMVGKTLKQGIERLLRMEEEQKKLSNETAQRFHNIRERLQSIKY